MKSKNSELYSQPSVCNYCKQGCPVRSYTDEVRDGLLDARMDCDCGYVIVANGTKIFERYPGRKGTVRDIGGNPLELADFQSLLIIESGVVHL